MGVNIEVIPAGTVTSPKGFLAGATYAGIKEKTENGLDLAILYSEVPCTAAALFTTNRIKAAPVLLSQQRLQKGRARALVVNSRCANACTGEQGLADATEMAGLAAKRIGVSPEEVLVSSTGVIGVNLPMARIRTAIDKISFSADGGHEMARAIMTTDTVPKEIAVRADGFVIGGVAKGSGMIQPNLATMLCFLTTDASVDAGFLKKALKRAADISLNMVSIDEDTSTNDMVLLMANGMAGNEMISESSPRAAVFQEALDYVCLYLAKAIARDAEGATKLVEVTVNGALNIAEARLAARTIASSPLVKAAIHGSDPNWGRVLVAVGRSGVAVEEAKIDLDMGGVPLTRAGRPVPFDREEMVRILDKTDISIVLNLNLGSASATGWGCDLSEEYVTINSEYTT